MTENRNQEVDEHMCGVRMADVFVSTIPLDIEHLVFVVFVLNFAH